jgi:hypothetical protein
VIQKSVSSLQHAVDAELASKLYQTLYFLSAPQFVTRRLRLPCIAFAVTEITQSHGNDRQSCSTFSVKADGLQDLLVTTADHLIQFSPERPTRKTFLLVRPWDRSLLELHHDDFEDFPDTRRELLLIAHLGQPFSAFLLAQQWGVEYKRIASDQNITAQVKDMTAVRDMMDVRTLEIL